jgi:tetratricopeptide (TPR) repeat protein
MKKILILSLFLFFLIINLCASGEQLETRSPWEQLENKLRGMLLNFLNDASATDKYIPCPSTLPAVNLSEMKEYFIITTEIQSALESAGIKEPVTIVLSRMPKKGLIGEKSVYNYQKELTVNLGTYTPIVDSSTQEQAVIWSLPELKSIKIPRETLRMLILERVTENEPLLKSEEGTLAFKNASKDIKAEIEVTFQFPFDYEKYEYGPLDQYLIKRNIQKAKKHCSKLRGSVQRECYHILADALFRQDIEKSITKGKHEAIEKYCKKQEGELQKQCYRIAADTCISKKEFKKTIQYYEKSGFKESHIRIGEIYFILGDYKKAVAYFEKGDHSAKRAKAYGALADLYNEQGEKALAKKYYKKAVLEYEWMIKAYDYRWNDADNTDRLRCRNILETFEKNAEEVAHQQKIDKILEKTAAYCHRLETELIHFFCKEVISENSYNRYGKIKKSFVYEYQLIKEDDKTTERRIQLKLNGVRTRKEEVPLGTSLYQYKYLIYGPIAFFNKFQQRHFDYKIIKEEMFNNQRAVVIEAIPLRIGLSTKTLCGKIWLDADDENFAVLKIEWHPKFLIENFKESMENAWRQNFTLKIDYYSEFGIKKNGIRFPSKYLIKEYHINENGKEECKASMDVVFKDYRFFSVGTEVTYH